MRLTNPLLNYSEFINRWPQSVKEQLDLARLGYISTLSRGSIQQSILILGESSETAILKSILEQDHLLLFANDDDPSFAIACGQNPDLILIDITTLGNDGYELSYRFKNNPSTSNTPIILIASLEEEGEARGYSSGAADYITKPLHPETVIARVRNLLNLKRCLDFLDNMPAIDVLTGIINRHQFEQILDQEWKRAIRYQTPLSLILMDIDCFQIFNDTYGYPVGDDCLRIIARALTECAKRDIDHIARYGGDEFTCLLPNTDAGGAMHVAQQIQEKLESLRIPHTHSSIADHITMSIAITTARPSTKVSHTQLIQKVGRLLAEVKRDSHNRIRSLPG